MSVESEGVVGAFVFVDAVLVVNELHSFVVCLCLAFCSTQQPKFGSFRFFNFASIQAKTTTPQPRPQHCPSTICLALVRVPRL